MDWKEILMLDQNEEEFERGLIGFPIVCDATQIKGQTVEEFYSDCRHNSH